MQARKLEGKVINRTNFAFWPVNVSEVRANSEAFTSRAWAGILHSRDRSSRESRRAPEAKKYAYELIFIVSMDSAVKPRLLLMYDKRYGAANAREACAIDK